MGVLSSPYLQRQLVHRLVRVLARVPQSDRQCSVGGDELNSKHSNSKSSSSCFREQLRRGGLYYASRGPFSKGLAAQKHQDHPAATVHHETLASKVGCCARRKPCTT